MSLLLTCLHFTVFIVDWNMLSLLDIQDVF